jgi:hypothetical protein
MAYSLLLTAAFILLFHNLLRNITTTMPDPDKVSSRRIFTHINHIPGGAGFAAIELLPGGVEEVDVCPNLYG